MSSYVGTSITDSALEIMVSCDRVLEVWTLYIESRLGLPKSQFH
jgi:hypothetical protein